MASNYLDSIDGMIDGIEKFQSNLCLGLHQLENSLAKDFISVDWMLQAIDLIRTSNAAVLDLVQRLTSPVPGRGRVWANAIMDETVKLSDVCKVLKIGVFRLQEYATYVRRNSMILVIGPFTDGNAVHPIREFLASCRVTVERMLQENKELIGTQIEAEGKISFDLRYSEVDSTDAMWSPLWGMIYPLRNTNSFISMILLWGVLDMDGSYSSKLATVHSKTPWAISISLLQASLIQQIDLKPRHRILLQEFVKLEACLQTFSVRTNWPIGFDVQTLWDSTDILKGRLDDLEWRIDDLVDDIHEGRRRLISWLSRL
ncbi:hypothetical protein O6H91_11G087900 [Diphasiastrum complanatum]|uniref:Uncharacterized protein n=1 Tax=Diphasiastrum complanatum TaxID=34168 RepID=A0ACC2CBF6_DIPCM|nr:hypothetical protein O6H91_11G087900 [Diphasiastrum complanatum]